MTDDERVARWSKVEAEWLDTIRVATGVSFPRFRDIPTDDKKVAELVLPVLATLVDMDLPAGFRGEIYRLIGIGDCRPFFEQILTWWENESDRIDQGRLTNCLIFLLKTRDAERVWRSYLARPDVEHGGDLLRKLSTLKATSAQVREYIVDNLERNGFRDEDLSSLAEIDDSRIRAWFLRQEGSENETIRWILKKLNRKKSSRPEWLILSPFPPPEVGIEARYSTECDLAEIDTVLASISKEFGFKLPKLGKRRYCLENADTRQWFCYVILDESKVNQTLWLRAEDTTTVEVVLTGRAQEGSVQ